MTTGNRRCVIDGRNQWFIRDNDAIEMIDRDRDNDCRCREDRDRDNDCRCRKDRNGEIHCDCECRRRRCC